MENSSISNSIEAEFARRLAGNEKKTRDRAIKKLRQFMNLRSQKLDGGFTRDEMLRIWKGLFYCMWMSDKPLVQEELAKEMAALMTGFANVKTAMLFFETFFTTMQREWKGIDRLRMDKFYLLVRYMLHEGFQFLKLQEWNAGTVDWLLAVLKNGPISYSDPVIGIHYHLCDIYVEELRKVGKDNLTSDVVMKFLDPYCILMAKSRNYDLVKKVKEDIFQELIEASDVALKVLKDEEEEFADAGGHTQVPVTEDHSTLKVDYSMIANRLFELASGEDVISRNRKKAYGVVKQFRELAAGRLPLDNIPDIDCSSEDELKIYEEDLVEKLMSEETQEFKKNRQHVRRKKRKQELRQNQENSNEEDGLCDEKDSSGHLKTNMDNESNVATPDDIPKKKTKKRRKKKVKPENSVILGSTLPKLISESEESQADVNNTIDELSTEITQSKDQEESPKTATPGGIKSVMEASSMPDIVQDVAKKHKAKLSKRRKLVEDWLKTENSKEIHETVDEKNEGDREHLPLKVLDLQNVEESEPEQTKVCKLATNIKAEKKGNKKVVKAENFANIQRAKSLPSTSLFFKTAVSKVKNSTQNKHLAAIKRKHVEQIATHSPKKVAFEMSKTQVQPFRKTDKSTAVSPSPNNIAFDPRKKPNFGLLKTKKQLTPHSLKKRKSASDFF